METCSPGFNSQSTHYPNSGARAHQPPRIKNENTHQFIGTLSDIASLLSTDSEISDASDDELEEETLADRLAALKDIVPPSARRHVSSTVSSITSFGKSSLAFSGKALWIISTSAFLIGVPWALAYAEEEQYIQMEREQGMIKGANEVCYLSLFPSFLLSFFLWMALSPRALFGLHWVFWNFVNILLRETGNSPLAAGIAVENSLNLNMKSRVIILIRSLTINYHRCSPLALKPRRRSLNQFCKLIPLRKPAQARTGTERIDCRSHRYEGIPFHNDVIRLAKEKGSASTHPRSIYWTPKCHLGQYKALSIKQMLLAWRIWFSNALGILASLLVLFFLASLMSSSRILALAAHACMYLYNNHHFLSSMSSIYSSALVFLLCHCYL